MAIIFDIGFQLKGKDLESQIAGPVQKIASEIDGAFQKAIASGGKMSQPIAQAVTQANALKTAIEEATTSKGLSFSLMQQSLARSGTSAQQLVATLGTAGPGFQKSFNAALTSLATANRSAITLSNKLQEAGRVFTQSLKFTTAQTAIRFISSSFSQAVGWVKDLDQAITNIAVVTGKAGSELDSVYRSILQGAADMRVASKEYAEASLIFYQQGLNDKEVEKRTQITIQAAKASGESVATMASQLTAIWNSYRMVGDEQARAASVGAKLAASTAVDFADIAEAMQISAAAAAQMGLSYDNLAAIIATVGDATQQSASVIGNAYKTIFSRFEQLTVEGTDGEITLNSVSAKLQALGINVMDASGHLKKLDDVIFDVGRSWDSYTDAQQLAIAELVGGTRQYNQFLSLMQNFDKFLGLSKTASEETGETLTKQFIAARDTIEAAAENSKESWNRAMGQLVNADNMKDFYGALEKIGDAFGAIMKQVGGLGGLFAMIGMIFQKQLSERIINAGIGLKNMWDNATPERSKKAIDRDADSQIEAMRKVNAKRGDNVDTLQSQGNERKIRANAELAKSMVNVNKLMNDGDAAARSMGATLKIALENASTKFNEAIDKGVSLNHALEDIKKTAEEAGEQMQNLKLKDSEIIGANFGDEAQFEFEDARATSEKARSDISTKTKEIEDSEKLISLEKQLIELQGKTKALQRGDKLKSGETQKEIDDQLNKIKKKIDEMGNVKKLSEEEKKVLQDQIKELEKQKKAADDIVRKWEQIAEKIRVGDKVSNELTQGFADAGLKLSNGLVEGVNTGKEALDGLTEKVKTMEGIEEGLKQQILQALEYDSEKEITIQEAGKKIKMALEAAASGANIDIDIDASTFDEISSAAEDASGGLEDLEESLNQSQEEADNMSMSGAKLAESLVGMTMGAINLGLQMSNLAKSFSSGSMTLSQFLSALVMIVPMMISFGTSIYGSIAPMIAAKLAALGLKLSIDTLTMGITVLITAVIALVAAFAGWASGNAERTAEMLEENAQKSREAAEATREVTSALVESVDAYQKATEGISQLTKDTQAYKDAAEGAAEAARNMIESLRGAGNDEYDQMADALEKALSVAEYTGDWEELNQLVKDTQENALKVSVEANKQAKSDAAAKFSNKMGSQKTISQGFTGLDEGEALSAFKSGEYSHIKETTDQYGNGTGNLSITSDGSIEGQIAAYEEALSLLNEMEKTMTAKQQADSEIFQNLKNYVDEAADSYNEYSEAIKGSVEEQKALLNLNPESFFKAMDINPEELGIDLDKLIPTEAFTNLEDYQAWADMIQKIGEKAEWSQEEIDSFINTNKNATGAVMANDFIQEQIKSSQEAAQTYSDEIIAKQAELAEAKKELQKAQNRFTPFGWGEEEKNQAIEEAQKKIQDLTQEIGVLSDQEKEATDKSDMMSKVLKETFADLAEQDLDKYFDDLVIDPQLDEEALRASIEKQIEKFKSKEMAAQLQVTVESTDYADKQKIVDGLSVGDTISKEDFDKLGEGYEGFFKLMEDGTYQLIQDAQLLEDQIESIRQKELLDGAVNVAADAQQYKQSDPELYKQMMESANAAQQQLLASADSLRELDALYVNLSQSMAEAGVGGVSYTAFSEALIGLSSQFDNTSKEIEAYQAALRSGDAEQIQFTEDALRGATVIGEAADKYGLSADSLEIQARELQAANKEMGLSAEQAARMAVANQRLNKGVNTLVNNWKDWRKELVKADKTSQDWADTAAELGSVVSDLVDWYDDLSLSSEFIADNLELIDGAAQGNISSILQLGAAVAQESIANAQLDESLVSAIGNHTANREVLDGTASAFEELWAKQTQWMNEADFFNQVQGNVAEGFSKIQASMDDLLSGDATLDQVLGDPEAFVENLNAYAAATGMTAEEMQKMLSSVGVTADVQTDYVEQDTQVPTYYEDYINEGTKEFTAVDDNGTVHTIKKPRIRKFTTPGAPVTVKGFVGVARIDMVGADGKGSGVSPIKFTGKQAPSAKAKAGNLGGGGGSKGGGGGKDYVNDAKPKKEKKPEARYENIDSSIQSLTTTIDKLNAAENDAWGKTKIRNLKALNYEISKQNTLLTSRLKEAKAYYDLDWANVINSSAINGAGFNASNITRNKDGSISNIEEIKSSLWETYVKPYIDAENALIGSTNEEAVKAAQEATETAREIYDEALELLGKLDDSVQQYKETLQRIVDNIRTMMSNIASEINTRLEFRIGIRERDLKRLERLADRWGELGVLNGEADKSLKRQWPKILQKMDNTLAEIEYTQAHLDMLDAAKEKGKDSKEYQQIVDYMTKDMNDDQKQYFQTAFDEWMAGNAALPAEFADMLLQMRDNLEDYYNDAVDNQLQQLDNIFTRVNDWLDKTFAEWDRVLDLNDAIINWSDALLEYTGAFQANDLSMQESVRLQNTAKMSNAQGRLDSSIAKYNSYEQAMTDAKASLKYIRENLGDAVKMTAEEWGDRAAELEAAGDMVGAAGARMFAEFGAGAESMMQAQIDEWRSAQQDLLTEIVDNQTELLTIAQENIEKEKEMAKKNVGTILNGLFTDLEDMADNYDRVKAEKDMTFDDYDQTYMTNKLQNMYNDFAENADVEQLESLTKWQEKLNKYKEEMVTIDENGNEVITHRLNMTQNEYDLLEKEFELEQLRAQFEEAQNNKNTMRLTRDASGNYSYVYSSDQQAENGEDLAQQLADKEYEYKKMLESIQDETISTTTQIAIELQNTIDGINQYLWEHDEKYRESVKVKISTLYKQLQGYGDESARIFDGLTEGVGTFGNVWDGSAGEILTGSQTMEGYIRDMATAICGPDGNMTTPDGSSYLGRILQAQEYWGTTANEKLEESMEKMASTEDKEGIPKNFGDIGDRVISVIEEKIGEPSKAGSAYGTFKSNSVELQKQIDLLLNGDESSVWKSYQTLGTHTAEELGAIGNQHKDILFEKVKEYIGTPDEDSDTTVLGRIKKLKDDMEKLRNKSGTELASITGQFETWATSVTGEIQKVINKIAEAIGAIDELQNKSEPDDPDPGKAFTHPDGIDKIGDDIDKGITGGPTGGGGYTPPAPAPAPQQSTGLSQEEIKMIAYSIWIYGGWGTGATRKARLTEKIGAEGATAVQSYINAHYNDEYTNGQVYKYWKANPGVLERYKYGAFDTGGYTGEFGPDGKLAILHEKELVLNKEDTENILKAVSLMRQTVAAQFGSINGSLAGVTNSITHQAAPPVASTQPVDQQVHIEASFPGVSVAQEIEDALNSLITQAAQYNIKR